MEKLSLPCRRITPQGRHCFYGYYDNPAFSFDGTRHLCHIVPFYDRLPTKEDVAQLAVIDIATGGLEAFADTRAWNFQQGSMLQWHPDRDGVVLYNDWREGGYVCVERDIAAGTERLLERPVANVAQRGGMALSVNFDRMFDFRPGYGYCQRRDPWYGVKVPDDDGVWLMSLATGRAELIIPYTAMLDLLGPPDDDPDPKIAVNHINFNTDGSRFVFLVRNFPGPGRDGWRTAIVTADTDGSMYPLAGWGYASHYHWRDRDVVAFHSQGAELGDLGKQLYELTDRTHEGRAIDPSFFVLDGHNSYSPDRNWMLYDRYPTGDETRELYLYDLQNRRGYTLGAYYAPDAIGGDIRCDLHPRWARDGRSISFDSIHEGYRGIYRMDLTPLIGG